VTASGAFLELGALRGALANQLAVNRDQQLALLLTQPRISPCRIDHTSRRPSLGGSRQVAQQPRELTRFQPEHLLQTDGHIRARHGRTRVALPLPDRTLSDTNGLSKRPLRQAAILSGLLQRTAKHLTLRRRHHTRLLLDSPIRWTTALERMPYELVKSRAR